jgi:hypothetical protein
VKSEKRKVKNELKIGGAKSEVPKIENDKRLLPLLPFQSSKY